MILLESAARPLLLLHAIGAGALVGAATHHLLSCRGYLRGRFERAPSEKRYARALGAAYLATFALGLVLYPAYRVRVRAEYLDSHATVEADAMLRRSIAAELSHPAAGRGPVGDLSFAGRLFDVKEHWTALAAAAALALVVLSGWAHPSEDRRFALLYVGLSAVVCSAAWMGAIVGLLVASYRAVGAGP